MLYPPFSQNYYDTPYVSATALFYKHIREVICATIRCMYPVSTTNTKKMDSNFMPTDVSSISKAQLPYKF